mmetsp:Transcript_29442/g.63562  ORF Transcript_29442/g.63562 Transcript_29442/m.63562 type:complete len:235 (-) Transcript_29442:81-785(-)
MRRCATVSLGPTGGTSERRCSVWVPSPRPRLRRIHATPATLQCARRSEWRRTPTIDQTTPTSPKPSLRRHPPASPPSSFAAERVAADSCPCHPPPSRRGWEEQWPVRVRSDSGVVCAPASWSLSPTSSPFSSQDLVSSCIPPRATYRDHRDHGRDRGRDHGHPRHDHDHDHGRGRGHGRGRHGHQHCHCCEKMTRRSRCKSSRDCVRRLLLSRCTKEGPGMEEVKRLHLVTLER